MISPRVFPFQLKLLVLLVSVVLGAPLLAAPVSAQEAVSEGAAALPVFNLQQCVEIAVGSSLTLAVSREQREQAAQDIKGAYGSYLPDLTLSRSFQRSSRKDYDVEQFAPGDVEDEIINSTYDDFRATSNWNLFSGLSKHGSLKSAKNSLKAAEASETYNRELVVQYVSSAYYDLLRYERLLEVAKESRDLAARELQKSETYFRLGSAAKSDVLSARVRLGNTELSVVQAQNGVAQSFANLAYAMNRPLAAPFEIDRSPLATDFALSDIDVLYAEALNSRMDLRSQEHTVAAREGDVTVAGSNLWPRLDISTSYTRYNNESPFRFGSQETGNFTFGYQVSWQIFDRMASFTQRSKAKASERIARHGLEQARLDVQLEVRRLYNNLIEARERVSLSRETITQAQEELRLAQERFRVGAGTSLERITAEVNLANARADEVQAICDFLINRSELDRAIGRGSHLLESSS